MTDDELDPEMQRLKAWADESHKIAAELMAADPNLPFMTAVIMAGDIQSANLRTAEVERGEREAVDVVWLVGSFARWDWAVTMTHAGKISREWFNEHIADLWRGSDPDDTSEINLGIWRGAYAHRGGLIRDGRPLPKPGGDGMIKVYRGGSPFTVKQGFAWTTDPKIAQKFAKTHGTRQAMPNGVVVTGLVRPLNVLAYLTERGESEVIVDPRLVTDIHPTGEYR